MSKFNGMFSADMVRYNKGESRDIRRLHRYLRKAQCCKNIWIRLYYRLRLSTICCKRGIEISPKTTIGKGLYLGHAYNITINPAVEIGENCNIHKGVTIGQENRGERKGVPKIGSNVWIGINAVVVGNVTIGDDVLIAPNSFVNKHVPSHSVVVGNPCIIKTKENATEGYINYTV